MRLVTMTAAARALGLPLLLWTALASAAPPVQTDWHNIKTAPLRPFQPQQPTRLQLDNGLVIFLQPNSELPLIDLSLTVRGGSRDEPAAKTGLVSLYAQTLRAGGTKSRTGDEIDDFLGARGARVEAGGGSDSVRISANFLKADFDDVAKLIVELLREPAFAVDKLDLAKRQLYTAIKRRNDQPMGIAMRESAKLTFGKDHPFARQSEFATVAAVGREDLQSWHQQRVLPNNIILGVSGDFDPAAMTARLRNLFGGWPRGTLPATPSYAFTPTQPGVFFIAKNDVNQANIQFVQLGTTRKNPDHYAIEVMNEILGGGFSARLFSNVRSKKGLAYSVRGGVELGWEHPATYRLWMGTASKNTLKAAQALKEEVDGMLKNPPTAIELQRAQESILNSFIFTVDSKEKILAAQTRLEFNGFPADYWAKYPAEIRKVTLDDVKRVAQKYLNPSGFALLVVGKAADFDGPLSSLGPVTPIDITIPPPPPGLLQQPPAKR